MNLATNRALLTPFTQAEFPTLEAAAHRHVPAHLIPEYWQAANRHLVKKILCEFTHEKIITSQIYRQAAGINHYELRLKDCTYYFSARHYQLDHLEIETGSIRVSSAGQDKPLDAMSLIIKLKDALGMSEKIGRAHV